MKLEELLNDPEYAELLEETPEEKELRESLFDVSRYENYSKMSLKESMDVLSSGQDPLLNP
tara:strand:- start:1037 stop:1219 length:183 start_codon:yes stop_codon:yes gene_type:complete